MATMIGAPFATHKWTGNRFDLAPLYELPKVTPKERSLISPPPTVPPTLSTLIGESMGDAGDRNDQRAAGPPGQMSTNDLMGMAPSRGSLMSAGLGVLGNAFAGPVAGAIGSTTGSLMGGRGIGKSIGGGVGGLVGLALGPLGPLAGSFFGSHVGGFFDPPVPGSMYDWYDQIIDVPSWGAAGLGGIGGTATGGWGSLADGTAVGYGALGTPSSFGFDASGNVVGNWGGPPAPSSEAAAPGAAPGAPDPGSYDSTADGGLGGMW